MRSYQCYRVFFIYFLIFNYQVLYAQLDTIHYLSPLHSRRTDDIKEHYLYISTPEGSAFAITIKDGAGNILATPMVSSASSYEYYIGDGQLSGSKMVVPKDSLNLILKASGLIIEGPKPFYANFRARSGSQATSLTSKGTGGMGTLFRYGGFPLLLDNSYRNFVASIMAVYDSTDIMITDYDTGVIFEGAPNVSLDTLNIRLDAGESYVVSGYTSVSANMTGFMGALIEATNPITFNNGNWCGSIHNGSGQDIGIDQSVPVAMLGSEFILISGDGTADVEQGIVVAHYDNTIVNAGGTFVGTINAGEYLLVDNAYYNGTSHKNMYVNTSQPAYMYQSMSAGGSSTVTQGLNFIPPFSCRLPDSIGPIPVVDQIGAYSYSGKVIAFTRTGAVLSVNGIVQSGVEPIAGLPNWETYKIASFTGDVIISSTMPVGAGSFGYSGSAGFAAYFTGFGPEDVGASLVDSSCSPSILTELNGLFDAYQWLYNGSPILGETTNSYTANNPGGYALVVSQGACVDTLPVKVVAPPVLDAGLNDTICFDAFYQLNSSSPSVLSVVWTSLGDGYFDDSSNFTAKYFPGSIDSANTFIDLIISTDTSVGVCGVITDTLLLNISAAILDLGNDTLSLCIDDSIFLNNAIGNTFIWSTGETTQNIWVSDTGFYSVTVSDTLGCTQSDSIRSERLTIPVWNISDTSVCGADTISIDLQMPYAYDSIRWHDGDDALIKDIELLGDTQLEVSLYINVDTSLCFFNDTFLLLYYSLPLLNDSSLFICENDSALIGTSGLFDDYSWNAGDSIGLIAVRDSGNYHLTVTDSNLCFGNASFNLSFFMITEPLIDDSISYCALNNATLAADSGFKSYLWSTGDTTFLIDINNLGYHYLETFDTNQCRSNDSIMVLIDPLNAQFGIDDTLVCEGQQIWININERISADSLVWIGGVSDTISVNIISDTSFYLEAYKFAPSCSIKDTINIIAKQLDWNIEIDSVLCFGDSTGRLILNIQNNTGPVQYTWSTGQILQTDTLDSLSAGNYFVSITDSLGCEADSNFIVGEPPLLGYLQNIQVPVCPSDSNGQIIIHPTGGEKPYSILWNNGITDTVLQFLPGGTYIFQMNDINKCFLFDSVVLTGPLDFMITDTLKDVLCQGDSTGMISFELTGGTPPYIYSWNNAQSSDSIFDLKAGTYSLSVTDSFLCSYEVSYFIDEPLPLTIINNMSPEYCLQSDAWISLDVNGGTSPYSYSWSNGAQSDSIYGLSEGLYLLTITDDNNCIYQQSFVIDTIGPPVVFFNINDLCSGETFNVLGIDTQNRVLNWVWDNGNGQQQSGNPVNISYADTGIYIVKLSVEDIFGCTDSVEQMINVYPLPDISLILDTSWGCEELLVSLSALNALDSSSFYFWELEGHGTDSGSSVTALFDVVGSWDVKLFVLSSHGCYDSILMSDTINIFPNPIAAFTMDKYLAKINDSDIQFWDNSSLASEWFWDFGDTVSSILQNPLHIYTDTGTYSVMLIVRSENACYDSVSSALRIEPANIIFMPNAFTPGNIDKINSEFKPVAMWDNILEYSFSVWNRWGEKLFETTDPDKGWDGICNKNKGNVCQQGGYLYYVKYMNAFGERDFKVGTFLLVHKGVDF